MKSKQNTPAAMEITTFKLRGFSLTAFITANKTIDEWLKQQPGFKCRHIAEKEDGTITDLLIWNSVKEGTEAMHKIMSETADSPVHSMIDQGTVSWNIYPVYHSIV